MSDETILSATAGTRYQAPVLESDLGQLGAGAGLRFRVSGSLALFTEGRLMYATSPMGASGTGWSSIDVTDQTRVDVVLGLTYLFR